MFAYNPPTQNVAGEIAARNAMIEAEARSQAIMAQAAAAQRQHQAIIDGAGLVGDIGRTVAGFAMGGPAGAAMASGMGGGGEGGGGGGGGLMDTIFNAYAAKEQAKSDSKIYGDLLKIAGPALGDDSGDLLKAYKSMDSDYDRANFGRTLFSLMGPMSNAMMANRSAGIRQDQQALTASMPGRRAMTNAAAQVAAGQGTMPAPSGINFDYVR